MIPAPSNVQRIVYMGTPEVGVAPLRALHQAGYDIPLVVSRPDAKRGRGSTLTPSPVKAAALELGLSVTDNVDDVLDVDADLGVVVAYGRIIGTHLLERLPMVNIHFSLLPRWRGAAPVERAILAGDETTGVCLMVLDEELDVGDIYRVAEVPIDNHIALTDLRNQLVDVGVQLLLDALEEGLGTPTPQVGEITWAKKIQPDELRLDWERPASDLHRIIRLGGAWTTARGKRLKVWQTEVSEGRGLQPGQVDGTSVGTGDGTLELIEVQPEGKPRRSAQDWANGARLTPNERLGT